MKKLLFLLMLIPFVAGAQITLEHTYPNNFPAVSVVSFSSNGKKFITHDTGSQVIKLYDMQHNLWKTITCPSYTGYRMSYQYAISDNLFNSDNNVEMVVVYTKIGAASYKSMVIDEFGNVLKDLDTAFQVQVHKDENNNYKLLAHVIKPNGSGMTGYDCNVYSLPGTMPCDECNALKIGGVSGKKVAFISDPIPNPSTGKVTINYMLPAGDQAGTLYIYNVTGQVVSEYMLTDIHSSITIQSNLSAGTYLYHIKTSSGETETKKLLIE